MRYTRQIVALLLIVGGAACTPVVTGGPGGARQAPGQPRGQQQRGDLPPQGPPWPVMTREHVDLWLHGYAMLLRDSAQVPVFRRSYREAMTARRRQENVLTSLDANHQELTELIARNPEILNGQFVPMYFTSFDQLQRVANTFIDADGNPRAAGDAANRLLFAALANSFPTAQDRDWLRLFLQCLQDESTHFFHQYWLDEQKALRPTVVASDSVWQLYRLRFKRFLDHTQQLNGELILSTVLGGEGRTINFSAQRNVIALPLPDSPAQAAEPIYVFAHEAIQIISSAAVNTNTTANEQRSGEATAYTTVASVRGGALLLQRVAPELLDGYMRYYLRQANVAAPAGDLTAVFANTFQLPTVIISAIGHQIDTALGGI